MGPVLSKEHSDQPKPFANDIDERFEDSWRYQESKNYVNESEQGQFYYDNDVTYDGYQEWGKGCEEGRRTYAHSNGNNLPINPSTNPSQSRHGDRTKPASKISELSYTEVPRCKSEANYPKQKDPAQ